MTNYEKIKEQLQQAIEKVEDKDVVSTLSGISATIEAAENEYTKLEADKKELMDSYKELILHSGLSVTKPKTEVSAGPAPALEDVIADVIAKRK